MHIFLVGINLPTLASRIQAALSPCGKPASWTGSEQSGLSQQEFTKALQLLTKLLPAVTGPQYSNWIGSQTQDWGALRTLPFCIVQQGRLLRGRKYLLKFTVLHCLRASWGNGGVSNPTSGRGEASVDSLRCCRVLLSYNINGIQL